MKSKVKIVTPKPMTDREVTAWTQFASAAICGMLSAEYDKSENGLAGYKDLAECAALVADHLMKELGERYGRA